ncbi:insertion sequence protein [Yersinia pekkanenii]|uniref:Insertion sequence protein n=1 Tax=Yersinia pekkanenii TaxID=1288385 RepID=A0ABM9TW72_9GAMM|nr:insertion sequence protein [Yersinia pekkanenii]
MAKVDVKCPFCEQSHPVKKHGPGRSGHQRYRCQAQGLRIKLIVN